MIAIYARQSIEKENSISIESQIAHCKNIIQGESKEYVDKGYSGSNINRPSFEQLMSDIKDGYITSVYCYRLDRISRNILDFANLQEFFKKHNCSFVSSSENLDTSSPMGRAMINIIMVFAQLERETIAGRLKESYFSRAKLGVFLGGHAPLGYRVVKKEVSGKTLSVLEVDNPEIVRSIFKDYASTRTSLGSIASKLNSLGIKTSRGNFFNAGAVRWILKNPLYAPCSPEIYSYYFSKGYSIVNSIEEFDGKHGCSLVGKVTGRKNIKVNPIEKQMLIIGAYEPMVDVDTFLEAQYVLEKNFKAKRAGTSSRTWLTGLMKCGECGLSVSPKFFKNNITYVRCSGFTNYGKKKCTQNRYRNVHEIELEIEKRLLSRTDEIKIVETPPVEIQRDMIKINQQIDTLMTALPLAEGTPAAQHIINKINALESQKVVVPVSPSKIISAGKEIKEGWSSFDIKKKSALASAFIQSIVIKDNELSVNWTA